jgi:hypothetical protein
MLDGSRFGKKWKSPFGNLYSELFSDLENSKFSLTNFEFFLKKG